MLTPSRNLLRISCRSCVSSVPLSDKAEGDEVRRAIIFTYCPSVIASSYGDDDLYDLLFGQTKERLLGEVPAQAATQNQGDLLQTRPVE